MSGSHNLKTIELDLSTFTKERLITAAFNTAYDLNMPVALWRMPEQTEVNLVVSTEGSKLLAKIDLEELSNGFIFSPFNYGEQPAHFIEGDFSLSFDFEEVIHNNTNEEKSDSENLRKFRNHFIDLLSESTNVTNYHINPSAVTESSVDYLELVGQCLSAIAEGHFEKVVPARAKSIPLEESFDPFSLFFDLADNYPSAFVSFVSIPEQGTWIGATPEMLIEKSGNSFKTVALAGTQPFDAEKSMGETAWTQKEIEEQAMVSRYIINCFKKIRLREYVEVGPKTAKAGNLLHLKTTYNVDTKATNFPELATTMLDLLHPTSAVAGMPKEGTIDYLSTHEGLNRDFFSGFLGPVNFEQKSNLFVNLRCMQLLNNKAMLYAGAGVTSDSNPEKEFLETESKFNTLLNVLNKSK